MENNIDKAYNEFVNRAIYWNECRDREREEEIETNLQLFEKDTPEEDKEIMIKGRSAKLATILYEYIRPYTKNEEINIRYGLRKTIQLAIKTLNEGGKNIHFEIEE